MLLKLPSFQYTDEPQDITASRHKAVRDHWVKFYESGGRICQISDGGGTTPCLLLEGSVLHLKVQPLSITEVWSGVTCRLSSVYVRCNGKTYVAQAMNGWRFRESDTTPLKDNKKQTSSEAKAVVNEFFMAGERPSMIEPFFEQAAN